ncbi:hypothetical protein [Acidocella sp.]|uniref:hypothetical protein n=1 Tax=Acidocella sp. TaxID=50710 RepID=UPI002624DCB4|nr:hypothetical protein [Acidocella sp.]
MPGLNGVWDAVLETPMGTQQAVLTLSEEGGVVSGTSASANGHGEVALQNGKLRGERATWSIEIAKPMRLKLEFDLKLDGDRLEGTASPGFFGKFAVSATRR